MNVSFRIMFAFVVAGIAGCASADHSEVDLVQEDLNVRIVHTLNDAAIRNAIIAQHTLYPYHFIPDSDQLNNLGKKDLAVLLLHYKKQPGTLNLHQGSASPDLYQARVATVADAIRQGGVDSRQVTIADNMPGGDGMSSERALGILEDQEKGDTPSRAQESEYGQTTDSANDTR